MHWMVIVVQNLLNAIIFNGLESKRDHRWAIVTDGLCIMTPNNHRHHVLWSAAESRVFSQDMDKVQNKYDSPGPPIQVDCFMKRYQKGGLLSSVQSTLIACVCP